MDGRRKRVHAYVSKFRPRTHLKLKLIRLINNISPQNQPAVVKLLRFRRLCYQTLRSCSKLTESSVRSNL
ncbi:MAG: hypothetical protein ACTS7I_00995 [Candidatus Hodgkinia cicadicola]